MDVPGCNCPVRSGFAQFGTMTNEELPISARLKRTNLDEHPEPERGYIQLTSAGRLHKIDVAGKIAGR
ncbi:4-hydroxybenzoate 3-monooxygenase [Anopheles sinensis]|uniref:4-hydroxybenzoate 3-monooxygenase n=1 Tax=Anopheles sinensis TaxID=74873 RepID=A0A084VV19_ANOSI|nr:4-hydroxybenzoate 3-monooxygenase [Anopheles sinensis]